METEDKELYVYAGSSNGRTASLLQNNRSSEMQTLALGSATGVGTITVTSKSNKRKKKGGRGEREMC